MGLAGQTTRVSTHGRSTITCDFQHTGRLVIMDTACLPCVKIEVGEAYCSAAHTHARGTGTWHENTRKEKSQVQKICQVDGRLPYCTKRSMPGRLPRSGHFPFDQAKQLPGRLPGILRY